MSETILHLECGHLRTENPTRKRGTYYCGPCRAYKPVVLKSGGYSWLCVSCHTGRKFGLARVGVERGAGEHGKKHPTHTVHIKLGNSVIRVQKPALIYSELPLDAPLF